jgi:hypothetical protein
VGIFYILPATLLQIPYFQKKIAHVVTGYLEEKIGTQVQVQQVDFRLFNQLILKDVYLEDQSGDTLLSAKRVAAGFDLIPLFKNQFRFSSVQLYTFTVHLNKETQESPLNIQYIIDAFQNKKEPKKTRIDLNIEDLSLSHGNFSYRVKNTNSSPGLFNPNDIYLSEIKSKIRLRKLTSEALDASIQRMSLKEQSGFQVKQLAFDLAVNADEAKIKHLDLELPHSDLHLTEIAADYSHIHPEDNFIDKIGFNLQIEPSRILLQDIGSLVPVFAHFREPLEMKGAASGTFNDIRLIDLIVTGGNDMCLEVDANVRDLNNAVPSNIYVNGHIKESYITSAGIQKLANSFSPEQVTLPEPVKRLGSVFLDGEISGNLNNLTTFVNFRTEVGILRADVNFGKNQTNFLKGKLATPEINIKELLDNTDFGIVQFEIDLNTTFTNKTDWQGTIDAVVNQFDYKAYHYENVDFSGDFTADSFKGVLNADSPDGQLVANGSVTLKGKDSDFNFSAKVSNLLLDKLNLTQKYGHLELSFTLNADFKGDSPDNLTGNVSFRKLLFSTDKGSFSVDQVVLDALNNANHKQLLINSDIVNGKIEGLYSLKTLPDALKQTLSAYLPSLIPPGQKPVKEDDNIFQWDFTINDTKELSYILELPVVLYDQSQITGVYNSLYNKFRLNAHFHRLKVGGSIVENGSVDLDNGNSYIELKLNGTQQQKKDNKLIIAADFKALNDEIYALVHWNDNKELKYKGKLDFTTQLAYQKGKYPVAASMQIQPSELVFNDSIWTLSPTQIQYREGKVSIRHFKANHNKQFIAIEGDVSKNETDQIDVSLDKVDLDYVFKSLNIKALTFGGIATGQVTAKDLYETRQLSTNLDVTRFSFNDVIFGNLALKGRWDDEEQGVEMKGNVIQNDSTYVNVDGFLYPVRKELSILFDARNTNAAFLRKYVDNIAKDLTGQLTGQLRLFGNWNDPTVEGNVWVNNGGFGVEYLNTRYTFTDWVRLTPDEISLKNVVLYDPYGNKAQVTGSVHHNLFDDFRFSANLSYENFLVFNATARANPLFYGRAFGTGTATISGTEKSVLMDVSMQNNEQTALTLNFMEQPDVVEYDFINFVTKEEKNIPETSPQRLTTPVLPKSKYGTDIRLNLLVNANNAATLEMIMDPATGDKISATGAGSMQIQYGTKIPLKVFGNYRIENGKYNFSFQQAFFRNFEIEDGSSINFRGDPFTADLNIKAAYTVTANLGDLDQQLILSEDNRRLSARDNIPVNCVLLLSGPIEQPLIKFDLELPGATAELERQVKSYIRTDDMMNRQMIYLLIMGRFYTAPEYARTDVKFNNDLSLLTSTLSSYISSMLGSLSNKFQVGTKFHQSTDGADTNTEVEVLLSSTLLNNRLILNGNFGYIDNPYLNTANNEVPLIGDFDIEYKLTKSGDIRLKGFNHYNYRNYYSLTPEMTQGFGILFKRDFNNLKDFFSRRKELSLFNLQPEAPADSTKVQ